MKKLFFMTAAMAAMVLPSCSNDEVVSAPESKAISFSNTFVDKTTRADQAADPSATVATLGSFNVYGYQGENLLFPGTEVSSSDQGQTWTYSPLKYWVTGANYSFRAVANANGTVASAYADGDVKLTITGFTNTGELDLLASELSTVTGATQSDDPVALTFKHILSKVKFTFVNGFASTDDATLHVYDITITNPYKTGNVVVSGTASSLSASWSDQATSDGYSLSFDKAGDISQQGSAESEYARLLVPSLDSKDYTVTFKVDLIANYGTKNQLTTHTYDLKATISKIALEAGKSYNFTATIDKEALGGIKPITFKVSSIADWVDSSASQTVTPSLSE